MFGALNRLGVSVKKALSGNAVGSSEPSLAFNFDINKYVANGTKNFNQAITHDRSGNATMVDSDGLLKWAPHNLLTYSEDFSNAVWNKASASVSVGSDYTTLTASTGTGNHWIYHSGPTGPVNIAIEAKAGTVSFISLSSTSPNSDGAYFNLSSGSVGTIKGSDTASIEDLGDGWFLCEVQFASDEEFFTLTIANADNSGSTWSAVGTETVLIRNARAYRSDLGGMVNNPARGDSYVPTTSAARYLPRVGHHVYNGTAWANEGMLHESEARTNLVTYSEDFSNASWPKVNASVSSDSSIAPDGNQTADTLTATSASANVYRYHTSGPFNSTVTFSVWLKRKTGTGTVSVGGTSVTLTSEWQLFTKDFAIGASGSIIYPGIQIATSGDEVYAWGAQLEAGAFPTSYIPTSGATATRAADVCSMPVSAFGYNKSEGSLVVDANPIPSGSPIGDQGVVSFDNGTTTDEIILLNENNDRCRLIIDPSGGAANDVNMSLSGAEGSEKYAAAWRINDAQIAHGGLIGAGDTSTTPPTTITRLNVGSVPNIPLNGHIKSIKYYPRRLSNAQLVELTS